jgi:peptide/nickel transport system substrate-binding protein
MTLALDRERFASRALTGLGRPAIGTYLPEAEPSLAPWPYDPREASRLLAEAGWKDSDGDGVLDRNGVPFSFVLSLPAGYQDLLDRIAVWSQKSLSEIGVQMKIEKIEWRAFQDRRRKHQFQAAMANWTFTPICDQLEIYHSSARDSGLNYGGFSDAEVDRLLEEGRRTFDPARRAEIYRRLRGRIHELEPISFLFHFTAPVLYDVRLEGVRPNPLGPWVTVPGPRAWRWSAASRAS